MLEMYRLKCCLNGWNVIYSLKHFELPARLEKYYISVAVFYNMAEVLVFGIKMGICLGSTRYFTEDWEHSLYIPDYCAA